MTDEELHTAIVQGLSEEELLRVCQFRHNVDYRTVAGGENYMARVLALMNWFERQRRGEEFRESMSRCLGEPEQRRRASALGDQLQPCCYLVAVVTDPLLAPLEALLQRTLARPPTLHHCRRPRGLRMPIGNVPRATQVVLGLLTVQSIDASYLLSELAGSVGIGMPVGLLLGPGLEGLEIDLPGVDERVFHLSKEEDVQAIPSFVANATQTQVVERELTNASSTVLQVVSRSAADGALATERWIASAHLAVILARLSQSNPRLSRLFTDAHTQTSHGRFVVMGRDNVYRNDARALAGMKEGQIFRATHPFNANPAVVRREQNAPFDGYVRAQVEARRRGVDVRRLYVLEGDAAVDQPEAVLEHWAELRAAQVEIRTIERHATGEPSDPSISDDFIVFHEYCVGLGLPRVGQMLGSSYYLARESDGKDPVGPYIDRFEELWQSASEWRPAAARASRVPPSQSSAPLEAAVEEVSDVSIEGRPSKRLMIVLRTSGCAYDANDDGCRMCDFKEHALPGVTDAGMLDQLEGALARHRVAEADAGIEQVDVLTLGSFLHSREVSSAFRNLAFDQLRAQPHVRKVVIESRASYVDRDELTRLRGRLRDDQILELGLGVESMADAVRDSLQKGLSRAQILRTIQTCAEARVSFTPYLLIGSPTLSEAQAVEDAIDSACEVLDLTHRQGVPCRISFEPVFVTQKLAREYPDYQLISLSHVVRVIRRTRERHPDANLFVGLNDEGLSSNRKPQGCSVCTKAAEEALQRFNGHQSWPNLKAELSELSCDCYAA